MIIDPWILAFSAATVIATIWMGFWSAKKSKTAHDFFVAGRSVSVGWNASAISGEYLSAASFMGVAGMVMSSGYDALWYPVCYACGYLFLLLFIAGPLRRFGAYTIPDFAEGRFDSPLFRKIAVVFVLFIGFFYTMPQMKGAGTTLAYIFPGMPYWAGVVLVGAVITLNVALGGMKGITLVQAFQYWAKMFAISVPIFVLMTVYGHYGRQIQANLPPEDRPASIRFEASDSLDESLFTYSLIQMTSKDGRALVDRILKELSPWTKSQLTGTEFPLKALLVHYRMLTLKPSRGETIGWAAWPTNLSLPSVKWTETNRLSARQLADRIRGVLLEHGFGVAHAGESVYGFPTNAAASHGFHPVSSGVTRQPLPEKAPADVIWLNPFGPLTTKAAKAAAAALTNRIAVPPIPLRADLLPTDHVTVTLSGLTVTQALVIYADITGRQLLPRTNGMAERLDEALNGRLSQLKLVQRAPEPDSGVRVHRDGYFTPAQVQETVETFFKTNGLALAPEGERYFRVVNRSETPAAITSPQAWLAEHERPLALLYTYSLIIALVCGTAGLPHILVRFYTNPDGVAAKRTTMWVMILIGVFYVFPPIFGVMGRNLMPELYNGLAGVKGTDGVVLKLPRILNSPAWGSILSGITCAGAFAAFMSTFSGLLVSLTGALAHDVYGRMLNPKSTPDQRMRMFKVCAVLCGGGAILLGFFVEKFEINKMVGWAFAIAATSYFPLLFLSTWWRGVTTKGAATGMLAGGTLSLLAIASTMFADQAAWAKGLADFYASHPLLRILAEQPAIWGLPLALMLMVVVSKLTESEVPPDIRMKMLVLHAPEKLGLKQEYIQEHQTR